MNKMMPFRASDQYGQSLMNEHGLADMKLRVVGTNLNGADLNLREVNHKSS